MNQFGESHCRFRRHPDRKSWSSAPSEEPKWVALVGGIIAGCFFAYMFYLGVG